MASPFGRPVQGWKSAMARVYMIRHGNATSAWGQPGSVPDPGLDALGQAQAQAACATLLGLAAPPRLVVTSPLRRCRETAEPFARALGARPAVEPRVAEIPTPSAVAPEARGAWLREAFGATWPTIVGDMDYVGWRDAVAAAVAASPGAAVFSHFVAINAAVSAATGDPRVQSFEPDNASITIFETDGRRLQLVARGDEARQGRML
jgi:broad specificity phosphatase PhoE